jgi:predicted ATPase/DNA-binding CsgD family transcriptional regulator
MRHSTPAEWAVPQEQLPPLFGRDAELARLAHLLDAPGQLVTLAGPAGSGKTRLAFEAARLLADRHADGAAVVTLSDLDDARQLPQELARALALDDVKGGDPTDRLIAGLRDKRLLLVLDNFERLIVAGPVLAQVRASCRHVSLLVTTRRRLGLTGEQVIEIGGLAVPAAGDHEPGMIRASPAVGLFVDRAMRVNPSLVIDDASLRSIAGLCRKLDGLPLAIELVAQYCRILSPDAVLARLDERSGSLVLADAVRWSFDLLSPVAARLLPVLGVFHEGWTLDAMEAVLGPDAIDVDAEMLDALVELIDFHLVEPSQAADGEIRFRLLETVRGFALGRLHDAPSSTSPVERHARHFATVAERCGRDFDSPRAGAAVAEIACEWPNIRAALEHLGRTGQWDAGATAVEALCSYWVEHGPLAEGHRLVRTFAGAIAPGTAVFAAADAWEARMAFSAALDLPGDAQVETIVERLRAAGQTLAAAGDWAGWFRVGFHRLTVLHFSSRADEIEPLVEELLECTDPSTRWARAEALLFWAESLRERSQRRRAVEATEQAIELARAVGHERVLVRALAALASFADTGSSAVTRAELEPGFSIAIEIGDRRGASVTAAIAGLLALRDGDTPAAAKWFRRTLDIGVSIGWPTAEARGLAGAVTVSAADRRWVEAARMHGAFRHHGERMRRGLPPDAVVLYDAVCERIAEQLGDRFETECAAGVDAGWDDALALARTITGELATDDDAPDTPRRRRRGPRANPELTDRELDVLAELVAGRTNQQIGERLQISAKTVMHHTMNVYRKLGVRGRAEAVAQALRNGLVSG